jgi:hypothetical protein
VVYNISPSRVSMFIRHTIAVGLGELRVDSIWDFFFSALLSSLALLSILLF